MKKISLPLSLTVSIPLKVEVETDSVTGQRRGKLVGGMTEEESQRASRDTELARENGGRILYATTSIEQTMEEIILHYFMGPFIKHDSKRDMFERELLQSSILSYHSKKELLLKIVNANELLIAKKKNKLQAHLKSIMSWRNAFAHGKIYFDTKQGCIIKYYSSGSKKLVLNDEYWDEVISFFSECSSLLDEAKRYLSRESQ